MIVGLQAPTAGAIRFADIRQADGTMGPPRVQMIFQDPYASLNPRWRVGDIIAEPIRELKLIAGEAAIAARVGDLLETVGLARADAQRFPHLLLWRPAPAHLDRAGARHGGGRPGV